MTTVERKIASLDWPTIEDQLIDQGYAIIEKVLEETQCELLKAGYLKEDNYRKTVNMQRYRFGRGEYKYYSYPVPSLIKSLRESLYPHLVPLANSWMKALKQTVVYPNIYSEFLHHCHENGQNLATPLILKYAQGGFNTLHQDLYGEVYFPIQAVVNLTQPGVDYEGGEFVLTQQIPRAQSQVKVLQPNKGDMVLFSTNFRPEKGARGYYRVVMKHGISEVTRGSRYALGVIFHDASR
jgi:hypothetical protein